MNIEWLKALLVSRKFWLAFLGFVSAMILFIGGDIDATQLSDAIVTLIGLVIGGIALEDAASKIR